jgi:HSP20 family protein
MTLTSYIGIEIQDPRRLPMAIIRWDPFRDMMTLRDKMNRLFDDTFTNRSDEPGLLQSSWIPAVDIFENENELVLTAEVPGIDEKDIEIKIEDSTLTIKGERKMDKETQEENYHRLERSYGSFVRTFSLPNYVDHDKIRAEHANGLLKIVMPKKPESKTRTVKILKPAEKK